MIRAARRDPEHRGRRAVRRDGAGGGGRDRHDRRAAQLTLRPRGRVDDYVRAAVRAVAVHGQPAGRPDRGQHPADVPGTARPDVVDLAHAGQQHAAPPVRAGQPPAAGGQPDGAADPAAVHAGQRQGRGGAPHPHLARPRPGKRRPAAAERAGQRPGGRAVRYHVAGHEVPRADDHLAGARHERDRAGALQDRQDGLGDAALGELDPHRPDRPEADQVPAGLHAEQVVPGLGDRHRRLCLRLGLGPGLGLRLGLGLGLRLGLGLGLGRLRRVPAQGEHQRGRDHRGPGEDQRPAGPARPAGTRAARPGRAGCGASGGAAAASSRSRPRRAGPGARDQTRS